jgi:methylase of polypeptide subunit release factors
MPSANGSAPDTYGLTRNARESARLNEQHKVWATNIGFLLHPRVVATLPEDALIADVGTGTGAWMLDLAAQAKQAGRGWT